MTPLHLAAESGHIKVVNYLCDEGADVKIRDNDGVNLNAGRLAYWVSSSKDPSNSLWYVPGCEENEYHIKITNVNTIQSW